MTVKVYIPVFSDATKSKIFSLQRGNPGIGGTQFTTIYLALSLGQMCPSWQIILVNTTEIVLENATSNIKQERLDNIIFFFKGLSCQTSQVVIASTNLLKEVNPKLLKKTEKNIICWSHHPFDFFAYNLAKTINLREVVCVGTYQFHSNKHIKSRIQHIQNIFVPPKPIEQKNSGALLFDQINIVHIGALHPAKGFLEIAKSWNQIKARFPNTKLHVIGSSSTYGEKPESDLVPTTLSYAEEILQFIPEQDIQNGEIVFYGNLGEEKFDIIRKCDLAILNPTGFSEAFPASPLECMACGVPVIASDDYGMSDCMRFFPELVIHGQENITDIVEWLVSDPLRYRELKERSIAVSQWFELQTEQIIIRWIRLIRSVFEDIQPVNLFPVMSFYGDEKQLIYRRDIRSFLRKFRLKKLFSAVFRS